MSDVEIDQDEVKRLGRVIVLKARREDALKCTFLTTYQLKAHLRPVWQILDKAFCSRGD